MTPEEEQRMKDLGRYDLINKGVCGKATSTFPSTWFMRSSKFKLPFGKSN